jgi:hypothetical protein
MVFRAVALVLLGLVFLGAPAAAVASESLIGSASLPGFKQETASSGEGVAFPYTATASGTVVTLEAYAAAGTDSATSQELGIYTAESGKPHTLLAHCLHTGVVTKSAWFSCTGISQAVVKGTGYWLAELPLGGGLNYEEISGGSALFGKGSLSKLEGAESWTERSAKGPAPFVGKGEEKKAEGEYTLVELNTSSAKLVETLKAEVGKILPLLETSNTLLGGTLKFECVTGCSGGVGGGSEITSAELDGDIEAVEVIGWCILGLLLSMLALYLWTSEIRSK